MKDLVADLGGHDLVQLTSALDQAYRIEDRPVVIVAYTIKGWRLPFAGHPLNHSLQMTQPQVDTLREQLGLAEGSEFSGFDADSVEGQFLQRRRRLFEQDEGRLRVRQEAAARPVIPEDLGETYPAELSTQQAFGRILNALSRHPLVAAHMVTASPDVAISTNLGSWINKMGVYTPTEMPDDFDDASNLRALKWMRSPMGHHIELGISENTLFLLLCMLGLSREFNGQYLLPIGTVYDPFVCRSLDALIYAAYSGSKFIFAGTPSGVSLSSEGGAHQSTITPSIGIELPNTVYYEPAFARELEWIMLSALENLLDRQNGRIVYLRLSTKPIQQTIFPDDGSGAESQARLRKAVIRGGYRLLDRRRHETYAPGRNVVNFFSTGVMTPECVQASDALLERGICANVIHVTSPSVLYNGYRDANLSRMDGGGSRLQSHVESLLAGEESHAPTVTVLDGHSHTLSFLGGVYGTRLTTLGVDEFGQSGTREELYRACRINQADMITAAERALDR